MLQRVEPYHFDLLTSEEAQREFPHVWATVRRDFPFLSDTLSARVVSLVIDTCPYCHAASRDCKCWDDE